MAILQLPSGIWYDTTTNQIVSNPGSNPAVPPTPAPPTQAPTAIPMSGGYYNTASPPPASPPAQQSTSPAPAPGISSAIPQSGGYFNAPPVPPTTPSSSTGTPYFMGENVLIQFEGNPQTFLLDTKAKTFRPFINNQALVAVYGGNTVAIQEATRTITADAMAPGGMFGGYQVLPVQYAIKADGIGETFTEALSAQLQARYGYPTNDNALEQDAHMLLGGFMNLIATEPSSGISQATINDINSKPNTISSLISALAYGGYTLEDIYRDVKRRELIKQGRTDLNNVQPISASETRQAYQMTEAGKAAASNVVIAPPGQLGTLDARAMKLSIYNIPDEAFKTLVPVQDPNSAEYKANMDKVLTPFFDIMMQQLTAQTDQEKALADYSWGNAKKEIERQLGVQLSNNALEAWGQIETAYDQFASQGIQGSGLQNEKIDDYLRRVRSQDQNNRATTKNSTEAKDMAYYTGFATPQQVRDLITSDPAKARGWGLVPSADILAALDPAALKAKYPKLTDADIQRYRSTLLDENGNYRSNLFQKYMTGSNVNVDAPSVQYIKDANGNIIGVNVASGDSGTMDIRAAKERQKSEQVLVNSMTAEQKAYSEFTKPDNPFLRASATPSQVTSANPGSDKPQYSSLAGALQIALQNTRPAEGQAPALTLPKTPPAPETPAKAPELPAYKSNAAGTQSSGGFNPQLTQTLLPAPQQPGAGKSAIAETFKVPSSLTTTSTQPINSNNAYNPVSSMNPPKKAPGFFGTSGFATVGSSSPASSGSGFWGGLKSLFGY